MQYIYIIPIFLENAVQFV